MESLPIMQKHWLVKVWQKHSASRPNPRLREDRGIFRRRGVLWMVRSKLGGYISDDF